MFCMMEQNALIFKAVSFPLNLRSVLCLWLLFGILLKQIPMKLPHFLYAERDWIALLHSCFIQVLVLSCRLCFNF